jgi:hypothetical protein
MQERLANALDIEPHQLFSVPATPEEALERLRQSIVAEVRQERAGVKELVREALAEGHKE